MGTKNVDFCGSTCPASAVAMTSAIEHGSTRNAAWALRGVERAAPTLEATDADGVTHRLWACADAEVHGRVRRALAPHPLYILDGHHRYETMLAYRDELEAAAPLESHAAANYGLMCLVAADDPGLIVQPTYRLVHGVAGLGIERLRAALAPDFVVEEVIDGRATLAAVEARLHAAGGGPALIALAADSAMALLATPRTRHGDVVADLPVSLLHTTTPLPAASPSAFTTTCSPSVASARSTSAALLATTNGAVGMPWRATNCLAQTFEPSSRAPAAPGPNVAMSAARSRSASPATSGASGPTSTGTIYLGQDLRFERPVRIGDTITVQLTVLEKSDEKKLVKLQTVASNQNGKVVVSGTASVMAPSQKLRIERPAAPKVTISFWRALRPTRMGKPSSLR